MNHLLPLAISNFLPTDLTRGAVCEPFWPGQRPKCLLASLSLGPLSNKTSFPVGASCASWSKVKQLPLEAVILFLAAWVNLRATILSPWGTLSNLTSLVTVPTIATMRLNLLSPWAAGERSWERCLIMREMEIG